MIILSLGIFTSTLKAQGFVKKENYVLAPWQVIAEDYLILDLKQQPFVKVIDARNNQTYIQVLADERGKEAHVLYQSNQEHQIIFLAISRNLEKWFNCNPMLTLKFESCVKGKQNNPFEFSAEEGVIDCLINRLNSCKNE